jgi:DNA (cytosine-5)-methyltransferase 1
MKQGQEHFTFVDLFAGIGGFKMALSKNGGICQGFSEIEADAIRVYCENFRESSKNNFGDITKIDELPQHDLLTAGVPCQSWSIAGKNLGFDDDRGQLWNDTLYLLQKSQPKAFIFENVKGLVDPRNEGALAYVLERIEQAGYYASYHVINSYDYGVSQNRVRIYIVGFRGKEYFRRFRLPPPRIKRKTLGEVLGLGTHKLSEPREPERDLFGETIPSRAMSLSSKNGFNDYFLFNDLRNGDTTIHSWDLVETSERQKHICYLLLRNRRKKAYGRLDGNPLSLTHFQALDSTVTQNDLDELVDMDILNPEEYLFVVKKHARPGLLEGEQQLLASAENGKLVVDDLKSSRTLKLGKIPISKTLENLKEKGGHRMY